MSAFKEDSIESSSYHKIPPQNFYSRLEMLESNLHRVTNQHDALVPLIQLVQLIPQVNKNSEYCQSIRERIQTISKNMNSFTNLLKQNISHGAFSSIDNNFKSSQSQIQELKNKMKELQTSIQAANKQNNSKLKEESSVLMVNLDNKINNSKNDIYALIKQFKKNMTLGMAIRNPNEIETLSEDYLAKYRKYYENQFENIKREIGLLQCEMEYLMDIERTQKIRDEAKKFVNLNQNQTNYKIGNVEQQLFIEQFQNFSHSNTNRIQYELSLVENSIEKYTPCIVNHKTNPTIISEIKHIDQALKSINSQVGGTKNKESLEAKRLNNRMNKIYELQEQLQNVEKQRLAEDIQLTNNMKKSLQTVYAATYENQNLLSQQLFRIQKKFEELKKII